MQNNDQWITVAEYCKQSGEASEMVHNRVASSEWARGKIYSCPDGKIGYLNVTELEAWKQAKAERKALRG